MYNKYKSVHKQNASSHFIQTSLYFKQLPFLFSIHKAHGFNKKFNQNKFTFSIIIQYTYLFTINKDIYYIS